MGKRHFESKGMHVLEPKFGHETQFKKYVVKKICGFQGGGQLFTALPPFLMPSFAETWSFSDIMNFSVEKSIFFSS